MTAFKPWTSGIQSDRSTNWATTTSQVNERDSYTLKLTPAADMTLASRKKIIS